MVHRVGHECVERNGIINIDLILSNPVGKFEVQNHQAQVILVLHGRVSSSLPTDVIQHCFKNGAFQGGDDGFREGVPRSALVEISKISAEIEDCIEVTVGGKAFSACSG